MAREMLPPVDVSTIPALAQIVEGVERTRRARRLTRGQRIVAVVMPASPARPSVRRKRATGRRTDGTATSALITAIDAGHGSTPALDPPRTLQEMTDIAADEHAERAARAGL